MISELVPLDRGDVADANVLVALVCPEAAVPVEANDADVTVAVPAVPLTTVWLVSEWDARDVPMLVTREASVWVNEVTIDAVGEDGIIVAVFNDAVPLTGLVPVAPDNDEPDVICTDEPVPVKGAEETTVAVFMDVLPAVWVVPENVAEAEAVLAACEDSVFDEADALEPVYVAPLLTVWLVSLVTVENDVDVMVPVLLDILPIVWVVSECDGDAVTALVRIDVSIAADAELNPVAPIVELVSVRDDDNVLIRVSCDMPVFEEDWVDMVIDAVWPEAGVPVDELPVIIVIDALVNGSDWLVVPADVAVMVLTVEVPVNSVESRRVDKDAEVPTAVVDDSAVDWTTVPVPIELLAAALAVTVFVVDCPMPVALLGIFVEPLVVVLPPLLAALVFRMVAIDDEAVLNWDEGFALVVGAIDTTILLLTGLVLGIVVLGVERPIDDEAVVNWDEGFVLTAGVIDTTILLLTGLVLGIAVLGVEVAIDDEAVLNWDEGFALTVGVIDTTILLLIGLVPGIAVLGVDDTLGEAVLSWGGGLVLIVGGNRYNNIAAHWISTWDSRARCWRGDRWRGRGELGWGICVDSRGSRYYNIAAHWIGTWDSRARRWRGTGWRGCT